VRITVKPHTLRTTHKINFLEAVRGEEKRKTANLVFISQVSGFYELNLGGD
jgi:hypothetical protein